MASNRLSSDPTVVAIGDSAMWGTGTDYRFKPPNLVHKMLNDGTPIPPVQLRARGGGVIGRSNTSADGNFDPSDDDYGFSKWSNHWQTFNDEAKNDPSVDGKDINNIKWTIQRDLGRGKPTHLEQLDQFADWSPSRNLDVPYNGNRKVRFYEDKTIPNPRNPSTGTPKPHVPSQTPPKPENVDIVLLNGSTNDVGLEYMMDFRNDYIDLMNKIEQYSYRDARHLLKKARQQFPNALLVLLGYPYFLSEWTSYQKGKDFLDKFSGLKGLLGKSPGHLLIERVIDGGGVFARAHQHYMRKAVADRSHAEARNGHPGVMYVSRGFGAIHAYEGPDPWAWSHGNDDTYQRRKHFIKDLVGKSAPFHEFAPIGHPNRRGSIKTAEAIVERYRERGNLSVGETAGKIDRNKSAGQRPRSLKKALKSYDLFPNSFGKSDTGSVMNALSHRTVDSIQLKFYRDTDWKHANAYQKATRTKFLNGGVDLYLEIEPGRNGNKETFRIDYESDKNAKDTPQFDRHANNDYADRDGNTNNDRVVTEVNIDPMAGRQMNGTVHTNYGKDRTNKEDNAQDATGRRDISWRSTSYGNVDDLPNNRQDFLPKNRWDTDRLKLWHVRKARIRAKNPGYWTLRRIEFTINGELTWTKKRTKHGDLEKTFKKATRKRWNNLRFEVFPP